MRTCTTLRGQGSSPHARGTLSVVVAEVKPSGIIPACAGSTAGPCPGRASPGDHPRMRGEHLIMFCIFSSSQGSSPHARGAHNGIGQLVVCDGIIPACAGSTWCAQARPNICWDHPRMRGEHPRVPRTPPRARGSSPHARGAQEGQGQRRVLAGIIPACAGSTLAGVSLPHDHGDHPRMRGEHFAMSAPPKVIAGSSPHARGARRWRCARPP